MTENATKDNAVSESLLAVDTTSGETVRLETEEVSGQSALLTKIIGSNITLNVSDIQIGAVELKDGDTDTRADIELDSAKNALFVQSETLATAANQLADGHNVTVDNAAGASAVNIQDGGNTITVDATNLDIRDLTSASDSVAAVQSGTWNINDISGTISLPTGAATAANQSTIIGHVDGIETLLTAIDADTSTIAGDTTSIDGKITTDNNRIEVCMPDAAGNVATIGQPSADNVAATVYMQLAGAFTYWFDGSTWDRARGDATDGLLVNLGSNNDITMATLPDTAAGDLAAIAGSVAGLETALNSDGSDSFQVQGNRAHDAVESSDNPVKIGGRAQDIIGAEPEEVADNDRTDALFDRNGRIGVTAGSDYKYADINDSTSGNNTIVAAQGAGKRIAVWSVMVVSDGTVDVRFEDGAGGTAFTGQIPLQEREGFTYSAGGLVPLWVGTANTLLNLELSAAVNVHGHLSYTVLDD